MAQAPSRKSIDAKYAEDQGLGYYDESGNFVPPSINQADNQNLPLADITEKPRIQKAIVSYKPVYDRTISGANMNRAPRKLPEFAPDSLENESAATIPSINDVIQARSKEATITVNIIAWAWWWWVVIFIFGLISTAALGMAGYLEEQNGLIEATAKTLDALANAISLGFLNWVALFITTWVIVWTISLFCLAAAALQYSLAGLYPLGGHGSGLKLGTFLLAFTFCFIPVFNLFPWMLLWMAAVFYYPK